MTKSNNINKFGQKVGRDVEGWITRPRPDAALISGRTCRLERFVAARHCQALFKAITGAPELWTYLPRQMPASADELGSMLGEGAYCPYVIIDQATDAVLGMASYMRIDPDHGSIEIGFVVHGPALQRSTMATEAHYLFARYAFDALGYRRYEWKCNVLNAASCQAAVRLGFRYEGLFRQAMVVKGRNRDTAWYAITDQDWPAIKAAMEAWLAPDNFDGLGRQRSSLITLMRQAQDSAGADEVIAALALEPHPEGGWFAETWRDTPPGGGRGAGTAIYYLLKAGERSHWHRVDAAELWLWHAGAPLALEISLDGTSATTLRLGPALAAGEQPQVLVPSSAWQAARSLGGWTLASCVVAPAFNFSGFELAPPDWRPGMRSSKS